MRIWKRLVSFLLVFVMMFSLAIPASAASIRLSKTSTTIYVGSSTTLKVTGTTKKVSWSTSKKSVATVSSKGKVTARKAGSATIRAKVAGKTLSCKVTVKNVALNKSKVTLYSGSSTTLKLYGGTIKSVKSSRTSVATISKSGKLTAKNAGSATIYVYSTKKKRYTCKVTVKARLSANKVVLPVGDYTKIYLRGATLKSVKTSSTSVATVSKDGKYIVIRAKKKGSATITAYDTGKHKYSCSVRVEAPSLSKTSLSLDPDETYTLKLNGNTQKVTWSSSVERVATVSSNGKVTAKEPGSTTIRAKVDHKTYSCAVTVTQQNYNTVHTVIFDSNGGSNVTEQAIYDGSCAYEPEAPTREGYVFDGWYADNELTNAYDFSTPVTGDTTLYAKWTRISVSISLDGGDYDDNIVNRTVSGSVTANVGITTVRYELAGNVNTTSGQLTLDENQSFQLPVLLEDGSNTLTVTADTADGSSTSETLTLTYDSGQVYDLSEATSEEGGWLIVQKVASDGETDPEYPITPDEAETAEAEDSSEEPSEEAETSTYYAANLLNLYFDPETTFSERTDFVSNTLGGSVAGYLNTLDMVQVHLPATLSNAGDVGYTGETDLSVISDEDLQAYADALAATYDILESADVEFIYKGLTAVVDSNDPWGTGSSTSEALNGNAWWINAIGANSAWDFDNYYNLDYLVPVTLGVVDAGYQENHPDLTGRLDVISSEDSADNHGTHVSGIIAATADNNEGIAGITHNNASLLCYDAMPSNDTSMSSSAIFQGLTDTVEGGAKVVNFSLGSSGSVAPGGSKSTSTINSEGKASSKAMGKLLGKGYDFVVVQSAGNGNSSQIGIDYTNNGVFCAINSANCFSQNNGIFHSAVSQNDIMDRILVVSATDRDNQLTRFSNGGTGDLNEIAAPGDNIYSCITGSSYRNMSGTSMAAPMVTAVCGLT